MARTAWTLQDNSTGSTVTLTFPYNPKEFSPPGREATTSQEQTVSTTGANVIFQGRDKPGKGQFAGTARTQQQVSDIDTWCDKWYPLILTDDLGRSWNVLITNLSWTRQRRVNNVWIHDYTIDFIEVA